ncbi:Cycline T [Ectocarpus siliculosus]|uniref:Cycline T n=1 Tax=Ectocarpus siliculosus TaxID=2880 RepID=D8LLM1_ECTSI|nr:Cycline T [Ectocarpus siliculosus]|eukprot:CBN74652.1 Cycline T [Ectocarpus siliculosus]
MPNLRATKLYTVDQIRNSPSRKDGVSEALENDYRRKTGLFIKAAGKELELPVDAVATALVFFHKFFMLHSFQKHERFFVGSACLFLAAKVEESSKRVEQVMSKSWKVWNGGRDPPAENEKSFKRLREKILIAERCVLHTLGFQLTVEHPYSVVMSLLKKLFTMGKGADGGKGADKALNRQLSQAATSFVNDSLLTTLCLQYRPKQVAAAVVYLSYLYMGLPRVDTMLLEADVTVVAA